MRILVFHNKYKIRGGEDVVVERESALMSERGHTVHIHYESNDDIEGPISKAKVAFSSIYSESCLRQAKALIESFRPDVVHIHNFFPKISPSIFDACEQARVPCVFTLHNYRLLCANGLFLREGKPCELCLTSGNYHAVKYGCYQQSRAGSFFIKKMQDRAKRERVWQSKVSRFITLTEFAKSKFVEGGLPPDQIVVKANFCDDLAAYQGEEEGYYIYFGRLSPEKGVRTLLEAWRKLNFKLLLVGEEAPGFQLDLPLNVQRIGHVSQKEAWAMVGRAKGLIFPTECYEGGFPFSLIESMAIGVPIVASRIGGLPEYLRHDHNALLFSPGSAEGIVREVSRLESDPGLRRRLAEGARSAFRENFSVERGYASLLSVYEEVIANYK